MDPTTRQALRAAGLSDQRIDQLAEQYTACVQAGLNDDEIRYDPQRGLTINASGVRKLAAARGKTDADADAVLAWLADNSGTRH